MRVFIPFLALCLLAWAPSSSGQGTVKFDKAANAYRNVVVSVSPDLDPAEGQNIIDGIKNWMRRGSSLLYTATKRMSYIGDVKILIPSTWTNIQETISANDIAYEDGVFRVEVSNPLYGDAPYTQRSSTGCGQRGEFVHVTQDFVRSLGGDENATVYGPAGNTFVHEWAKLRYGVFEEFGFPGDDTFPLFHTDTVYVDGAYQAVQKATFCTDRQLQGEPVDMVTGGDCTYDEGSGVPDSNCVFVPSGDNSAVTSSLMAAPFLDSVDSFCESDFEVHSHDAFIPTRHNLYCGGSSVWDVVAANEDFDATSSPLEDAEAPATHFDVVLPQLGNFVMVIDRSGSMKEFGRMDRLKQSGTRWLKLDVQDGSQVGITSFSNAGREDASLTVIDEDSRDDLGDVLGSLEPGGGTCLAKGVLTGLETLAASGGVMLFMTDGNNTCSRPTLEDIEDEIVASGVRIVTMALSSAADPKLEHLAQITNGKTYFIPDGTGVEDLNNAFSGSLTYQPAVSTDLFDILVATGSEENVDPAGPDRLGHFFIDSTIGRDVQIRIDYGYTVSIEAVSLYRAGSADVFKTIGQSESGLATTFLAKVGNLEAGEYDFSISTGLTGSVVAFADYMVTSKPQADTLPLHSTCYVNTGNEEIDLGGEPLAVMSKVTQGNSPVMNAQVFGQIEKEGEDSPITIELLDDGVAADLVANDGVYSRYFSEYDGDGRYTLKCQVSGDDTTTVNGGFINARRKRRSALVPVVVPTCCGSDALSPDADLTPTGSFQRPVSGGSIKLKNVPAAFADVYPPGRVTDLKVAFNAEAVALDITFTSPGDDYFDAKNATRYDIRLSPNATALAAAFDTATALTGDDLAEGFSLDTVQGGELKTLRMPVQARDVEQAISFAMKTEDKTSGSDLSNIATTIVQDAFRPSSIEELDASFQQQRSIHISFIAPGDDGMNGKVDTFELRFGFNESDLSGGEHGLFSTAELITQDMIITGSLDNTVGGVPPGEEVTLVVDDAEFAQRSSQVTLFLAARAVDDRGNLGGVSPVANVTIPCTDCGGGAASVAASVGGIVLAAAAAVSSHLFTATC